MASTDGLKRFGAWLKSLVGKSLDVQRDLARPADIEGMPPSYQGDIRKKEIELRNNISKRVTIMTLTLIVAGCLAFVLNEPMKAVPGMIEHLIQQDRNSRLRVHGDAMLEERGVRAGLPGEEPALEPGQLIAELAADPDHPFVDLLRAQRELDDDPLEALELLDLDAQGVHDLHRLVKQGYRFANVYLVRGDAYMNLGDLRSALQSYRQGVELDPRNPNAHSSAGVCAEQLGLTDEAIEHLGKAIELFQRQPGSDAETTEAHALNLLLRGLTFADRGDVERAQIDLQRAERIYQDLDRPLSGELLDALQISLTEAVSGAAGSRTALTDPSAGSEDGRVPVQTEGQGDPLSARELYDEAVEAYRRGDRPQSLALLERSSAEDPGPALAALIGHTREAIEDRSEAR